MHDRCRLRNDLVQEHCCALPGGHPQDEAVVDVLQTVCPGELHEFKDLKELGDVEVLLGGDDVYHLVEVVFFVSLDGASDISGEVDRRSICVRKVMVSTSINRTWNRHDKTASDPPFFLKTALPIFHFSKSTNFAPS